MLEVEVQPIGEDDVYVFFSDPDSLRLTERNSTNTEAIGTISLALGDNQAAKQVPCIVEYDTQGERGMVRVSPTALAELFPPELIAAEGGEQPPQATPEAPVEDDLDVYIRGLATWSAQTFDGYVYDYQDREQYLPKLLKITAAGERSNLQGAPRPSWTTVGVKLAGQDDGVELPGEYIGYFEVEQDYPYLYLSSADFERARKALEALAPVVAPVPVAQEETAAWPMLTKEQAVDMLIAGLKDDERRRELFWRQSGTSRIEDYDVDIADRDAVGGFVGNPLYEERGWAMNSDFVIQATKPGAAPPARAVTIDGAKLLVTEDNSQVWIQIPDSALT